MNVQKFAELTSDLLERAHVFETGNPIKMKTDFAVIGHTRNE